MKKVLKFILYIFMSIFVLLSIYTFFVTDVLKKDYVNIFGYSYFIVSSGSMSGTIEVNDLVFVKLTDKVRKNDIITFKNDNNDIITHRIIDIKNNDIITKGDMNNIEDDPIKINQVIGKVCFILSPLLLLKSISLFLIVFIFLALINFDKVVKHITKNKIDTNSTVPEKIFYNDKHSEDKYKSGLTITMSLDDIEFVNTEHNNYVKNKNKNKSIEILDVDDDIYDSCSEKEKEVYDLFLTILECKHTQDSIKLNKDWVDKFIYVYKLSYIFSIKKFDLLCDKISNPDFKEIFNYDLNKVGLSDIIRTKLYSMPYYVYLRLMTFSILYNDIELFDGLYKMLKYKITIEENCNFKEMKKEINNSDNIKSQLELMKSICHKVDKKNVFQLDKVEKLVDIEAF